MEAKDIKSLNDCQRHLEGCINDFEGGVSTKEETLKALREYIERITELAFTAGKANDLLSSESPKNCPCCGSDKIYRTMAVHCNRCATTTEI